MSESPAVIGIVDHRGWAICVSVGVRGEKPVLVDRRRVELLDSDLSSQPFHHEAAELDLPQAEELVRRVRESAARCSLAAVRELRDALADEHQVLALVLREGPRRPVPQSLAEIFRTHSEIEADGEIYRGALRAAGAALGLEVAEHSRGGELAAAAAALGTGEAGVASLVGELGREAGPPWRVEHKGAAAAALGILARQTRLRC